MGAILSMLAACGGSTAGPSTTPGSATTPSVTTTASGNPLDTFQQTVVYVSGEPWTVAVADTAPLRAQGLMGVTDLGGLDGMFFVYDEDTDSGFWMKDTLMPLDIAFFTASGAFVDLISMTPCTVYPCEVYRPSGTYRYAIEAPPGSFTGSPTLAVTEG